MKWQSVNIPFNVRQGIWRNLYLTAGATLVRQITGYYDGVSAFSQQKIPEYNWQAGAGYQLNDLNISVQYSRGFSAIDKSIKTSETSSSGVTVRHLYASHTLTRSEGMTKDCVQKADKSFVKSVFFFLHLSHRDKDAIFQRERFRYGSIFLVEAEKK